MKESLTKTEMLLYDLIYEEDKSDFEINIIEYIDNISLLDEFHREILEKIIKSGINVKEQAFILTKKDKIWKIKLDRTNNVE